MLRGNERREGREEQTKMHSARRPRGACKDADARGDGPRVEMPRKVYTPEETRRAECIGHCGFLKWGATPKLFAGRGRVCVPLRSKIAPPIWHRALAAAAAAWLFWPLVAIIGAHSPHGLGEFSAPFAPMQADSSRVVEVQFQGLGSGPMSPSRCAQGRRPLRADIGRVATTGYVSCHSAGRYRELRLLCSCAIAHHRAAHPLPTSLPPFFSLRRADELEIFRCDGATPHGIPASYLTSTIISGA
jgi:hypothetical protein